MKALSITLLLTALELALAIDVGDYVSTPFLIGNNYKFDESPRNLERRQNGTEFCRTFPGDKDWPSDAEWSAFNATLSGALIKPIPRAAVCHSNWPEQYNEQKCKELFTNWNNHEDRVADPADLIYVYFQGISCLPSSDPSTPCTTGGNPEYVVNVTTPAQISVAIKFAKEKNIRLVIKNTGHDVSGKSTGAGSLSIWTHNMKSIEWFEDFKADEYRGPAIRVGAGVSLGEFYQTAEDHGVTAVGGECSTVGVAGGYSAGGGHSPSGGIFGMAADNIIELTAVLPNGTHAHITSSTAPDLFWAFRGGGGSTFGVVTSITVKVHPKIYTTVSQWGFETGAFGNKTVNNETFWQGVKAYLEHIPAMADSGSQVFAGVSLIPSGFRFNIISFVAVNLTVAEYDTLMAPFFVKLTVLGIDVTQNTTFHPSYYGGWQRAFPKINQPWDPNKTIPATGSRLIPRKNFEEPGLFNTTYSTLRNITDLGVGFIFYTQKNTFRPNITYPVPNSINPAYRDSAVFLMAGGNYPTSATIPQINQVRNTITKVVVPMLKKITPGGGSYMNEADVREDDWQQSFFGSHYPRLLKIKNEVDPDSIFWAKTAVGSEDWYIKDDRGLPEVQTGRLCRRV